MENFTRHEEEAVALAAGVIVELVDADAVWCFAARVRAEGCNGGLFQEVSRCQRVHLYLLAFVPDGGEVDDGMVGEAVAKKSGGLVTATVLVYRGSRLSRVKGNHRVFLDKVVGNSRLVFLKEGYVIPEFGNAVEDKLAKIAYWDHCKYMAVCCLEAESAIENPNAELVQAVLLHQAVEQVCLGLIYMFLGCRPNYFAPGYLLEICVLFMPDVAELFPRSSAEEKARFAHLELRMESLRYRLGHPGITDIEVLRSRVHAFLRAGGERVGSMF
jgi:hypothetical protein